ncbi:RNA polymerase subunit sigma-24 [Pseudohalioglobus lutimaris]|uniref:RNA polymerase subunit sigma-24 n=2 Tax=Pseudohalioglobus lutimaris TaxID=1737061 RepID=A0A2N5X836_9GAMM|nr:RNA polymerase subunit sigma-24 [Pseudohalioglobus lutimaris]
MAACLERMPEIQERDYSADETRWSLLMISAQSGNETDYRQLLSELSDMVNNYLVSRLGGYDFIDDCAQEVLIAVHEARHTYDPRRKFRPWLFAIIRHKSIDAIRRQAVRTELHAGHCTVEDHIAGDTPLESGMTAGRLISALSPRHREAIKLTKILGFTTAEAASRLAISESAMKVRVHRAVSSLRKLMEAEAL